MLTIVNSRDGLAAWRPLEFLSERTSWQRLLWQIEVVLAMEELFEACVASKQGHLGEGSIKRMASSLQKRMGVQCALPGSRRAVNICDDDHHASW